MPASQDANYIVLCSTSIMNPTIFLLIYLFFGPLLWFSGLRYLRFFSAFALFALFLFFGSDSLPVLFISTFGTISLGIPGRFDKKPNLNASCIWLVLCTGPLWAKPMWLVWPGRYLESINLHFAWQGIFYERYGSDSAFYATSPNCSFLILFVFCIIRIWRSYNIARNKTF